MPGRVFISCGQRLAERQVAQSISDWFRGAGFEPYVAIEAQSLDDVNSGIIDQLRRSDYYVFVDFRRERIKGLGLPWSPKRYRGSLFTNQELAIAHALRFPKAIFLQQDGVELEGMLRYMTSNAKRFRERRSVLSLVEALASKWSPSYTRHLTVGSEHWAEVLYTDHTGTRPVRVFEVDIQNNRNDLGALNAIARLTKIDGIVPAGIDSSPLKATGQQGYSHTISPESWRAWDLLAVHLDVPATVSLNSSLDIPRRPLFSAPGDHVLTYNVFADRFDVLSFDVLLSVSADPRSTTACVDRSKL